VTGNVNVCMNVKIKIKLINHGGFFQVWSYFLYVTDEVTSHGKVMVITMTVQI